jgi:hemerythrin-like domain-containing protein
MGIQIGAKPDSGFDDPIGMLKDCHRRIEHFLNILCVVAERTPGRALTDEETAAIQAALHYFRLGGKRHNADEEDSLFPRLRAQAASAGLEELEHLEHDHRIANDLHDSVDSLYSAWIAKGFLNPDDEQRLVSATEHLNGLYNAHIEMEEGVVFPRAAEILDHKTIVTIGEEFRARRK